MLFAICKLVVFKNRVVGIMFELKTEELGRKGCILWSFIIYSACQMLGYQRTVTKWVKYVACMGVKVILKRISLENGKERVHSEGLCEYGGIILKWVLTKVSEWNLTIHASGER